jgi:molybdate transport system substrate-binding protein
MLAETRRRPRLTGALAGLALLCATGLPAAAAEITLLSSVGVTALLDELLPQFERATGHKVVVHLATAAATKKAIDGGAAFDVAILTPNLVDDLIKEGKAVAGTNKVVARSGLGVSVREGAAKPDIGSDEAFIQALRAAKSVGYTDPALGGASGVYLAALIERLGLAAELRPKITLAASGRALDQAVARGEIEIGLLQISEILPEPGIVLVGPLPPGLQNFTSFSAGIAAHEDNAEAANALVAFLTSPAALPVLKAKGMEP